MKNLLLKKSIAITVICVSLIIIGFVVKYYYDKQSNYEDLRKNGEKTFGVVVDRMRYGKSVYIECQYKVGEVSYKCKTLAKKFENINEVYIEVGDTLLVYYDRMKPKNGVIELESALVKKLKMNRDTLEIY